MSPSETAHKPGYKVDSQVTWGRFNGPTEKKRESLYCGDCPKHSRKPTRLGSDRKKGDICSQCERKRRATQVPGYRPTGGKEKFIRDVYNPDLNECRNGHSLENTKRTSWGECPMCYAERREKEKERKRKHNPIPMYVDMGWALEILTEERGLSTYKAAREIGVNRSTIQRWKRGGKAPRSAAIRTAKKLYVDLESIVAKQKKEEEA